MKILVECFEDQPVDRSEKLESLEKAQKAIHYLLQAFRSWDNG